MALVRLYEYKCLDHLLERMLTSGSKMYLNAILKTCQHIAQICSLSATFVLILLEIIQTNQPEGLHLLVRKNTESEFKICLKAHPKLEELLAQMS